MAEEILQNKRIDQLDPGIPGLGDYGVYRDMVTSKTKKFLIPVVSATTGNFEWSSVDAAAGDYDLNDVVTKGAKWWQSAINNNPNVPGVDATWTELPRASAGLVKWAAGVFVEDEPLVWNIVGTTAFVFKLVSATRPYSSTNFTTELAAGDWELLGALELISVSTAGGTITLDFLNLVELAFKGSATIAGNKLISMVNDSFALVNKFFKFSVDAAGRTLTFDSDVKHVDWDGNWAALVWTAPAAGDYILKAEKVDGNWYVQIFGTF